ncbi:MAG: F0F1 ATP synthase subunit A [Candidatus Nanopelagicus sp.]
MHFYAVNLAKGEGFNPPDAGDFVLPPIFGDSILTTKPVILVFFSVFLVASLFIASSRKAAIVPSRLQFAGEMVYGFVRNEIGQDVIGSEFRRFVPFLFTIFTFVLTNNLFGIIPLIQFPTMSRIGFPVSITLFVYGTYHFVAIRKHGILKYLKDMCFMPGIPKLMYIILAPLEFATYFLIRPLTLAMRLFGNMFAGHLLLILFTLGGEYMLNNDALILKFFSVFSFGFSILFTFFELFVQCLQAYIFTLLTALYIAGALADEH